MFETKALFERPRPAAGASWIIKEEQDGITAPDGTILCPVWSDVPDVAKSRQALDEWAATNGIVEQLTQPNGWCPWWYLRFDLTSSVLFRLLPWARALHSLDRQYMVPGCILLHDSPVPQFSQLLRCLWPSADIRLRTLCHRERAGSLERIGARTARAARAIISQIRLLRMGSPAGHERVLVVTQNRYMEQGQDLFFTGVRAALQREGLQPVLLIHHHGGNNSGLCGIFRDFGGYLAADAVYIRAWRTMVADAPLLQIQAAPLVIDGVDFLPLLQAYIAERAGRLAWEEAVWRESFPAILRQVQAKAVVLLDENGAEHFLHSACVRIGIPTIAVQHGCIHKDHAHYIFPRGTKPGYVPLASKTCVFGDHYRDLLMKESVYPSERIEVTGAPHKEWPVMENRPERTAKAVAFRKEVMPESASVLLLFTAQELLFEIVAAYLLEQVAQSRQNLFMVVRPHPRELKNDQWQRMISRHKLQDRVTVCGEPALETMLEACDVHISATSTALGEAALLGRPNIVLSGSSFGDWMGVLEAGVAVDLDSFPSLDDAVKYCQDSPLSPTLAAAQAAYAHDHYAALGADAAARVASVVRNSMRY